jgi:hypothetical protein
MARTSTTPDELFRDLIDEIRERDDGIEEGPSGAADAHVLQESSSASPPTKNGMAIKLPRDCVEELINKGDGLPFAPAGKVFREWVVPHSRCRRGLRRG